METEPGIPMDGKPGPAIVATSNETPNHETKMSTIYTVEDTFNRQTVSRHRSLEAAVKAERKFLRAVKRANGRNSYIPTEIRKNGEALWTDLDLDCVTHFRMALDRA